MIAECAEGEHESSASAAITRVQTCRDPVVRSGTRPLPIPGCGCCGLHFAVTVQVPPWPCLSSQIGDGSVATTWPLLSYAVKDV